MASWNTLVLVTLGACQRFSANKWVQRSDLHRHPPDYKSDALHNTSLPQPFHPLASRSTLVELIQLS